MLNPTNKNLILSLMVLLVLTMSLCMPFTQGFNFKTIGTRVLIETPCPQQKSAELQAHKLCQSYQQLHLYSILPTPLVSLSLSSDKIPFLFLLGLLLLSPSYFIYKPPK